MHATVVENKTGICKSQARLLGLEIQLHNLVVTYRKLIMVRINSLIHKGNGKERTDMMIWLYAGLRDYIHIYTPNCPFTLWFSNIRKGGAWSRRWSTCCIDTPPPSSRGDTVKSFFFLFFFFLLSCPFPRASQATKVGTHRFPLGGTILPMKCLWEYLWQGKKMKRLLCGFVCKCMYIWAYGSPVFGMSFCLALMKEFMFNSTLLPHI